MNRYFVEIGMQGRLGGRFTQVMFFNAVSHLEAAVLAEAEFEGGVVLSTEFCYKIS